MPSELQLVGMKLLRAPKIPTKYDLAAVAGTMLPRKVHSTWVPFLASRNTRNTDTEESQVIEAEDGIESYFYDT